MGCSISDTTNFNPFSPMFLQRITTGIIFVSYILAPIIGWFLATYLLRTPFWWIPPVYLIWFYIDRKTPEKGGRSISCIQNGKYWNLCKSYFNANLTFPTGFDLDPKRNYLFCVCPHGIIPSGFFLNVITGAGELHQKYPNFKISFAVLKQIFWAPILREWIMGLGLMSCTSAALDYVLSKPEGGHVVGLNPGGAAEAYYSQPGRYCCVIKNRKGFIKMALKHGTPLVPVIAFGEVDQFYQVQPRFFRGFQEFIRKKLQFAPLLFYGSGFFFKYGLIPRKVTLKSVAGLPIDVSKVHNPTNKQIDELHERFIKDMVDLFETYKHQFLEKPNETNLVLM